MLLNLPLTIGVSESLSQQLDNITAISNKLEALFNFRTMAAGWYGDEDCIWQISLSLESQPSLAEAKATFSSPQVLAAQQEFMELSDDVFVIIDSEKLQISASIALTDNELALVEQTTQLLQPLLEAKIVKVLKFIAEQQKLFPID